MFCIDQSETYKWPVTINSIDAAGKTTSQAFTAIFKRISQSRLEELSKANGLADRELIREVLVGWEDVSDREGNQVPFTSATLERLIENPGLAGALTIEFYSSIIGAKRKN